MRCVVKAGKYCCAVSMHSTGSTRLLCSHATRINRSFFLTDSMQSDEKVGRQIYNLVVVNL